MRKLGVEISQKGKGRTEKKSVNELLAELNTQSIEHKKRLSKKDTAKFLNVSPRTLRSYKKYFASLDNPAIKLNKNDRRPPKAIIKKVKTLSKKYKIKQTRYKSKALDRSQINEVKKFLTQSTFKKLTLEFAKDNFFGLIVRVNILFITKEGSFNYWITIVVNVKTFPELKTFAKLNNYIFDAIERKILATNSILGFEIIEMNFLITTNEIIKNKPKAKKKNDKKRNFNKRNNKNILKRD